MENFVRKSSKDMQEGEPIPVQPFRLSTETENEPSTFEIRLIINDLTYRYGFVVNTQRVMEEWLFLQKKPNGKETELFSRDGQRFAIQTEFEEGKGLETKTRENALFLSVCAQFNGEVASKLVLEWLLMNIITSTLDAHLWHWTAALADTAEKDVQEWLRLLLQSSDLGVSELECSRLPRSKAEEEGPHIASESYFAKRMRADYKISLAHPKRDPSGRVVGAVKFDLFKDESEGTAKLFGLGGGLFRSLQCGLALIIDEFDARLHPVLTSSIAKLFNNKVNIKGAQLVIATHDTNLLSYGNYRRDQIWFTEKDSSGATDLYSLVEYKTEEEKKIRSDASFEKDYIAGRYGAIPYLGDFQKLAKLESADAEK
jgi:hypothetical protein